MQFTVEVVPFQDRDTSALRSLFKQQNSQQHQEDTRLRHFSDEEISAYFDKLNASEHDIIEVRDAQGKFASIYGNPDATEFNTFTSSPLWQSLGAVQADKVYHISDDHWFLGIGLLGANRVLDDILIFLSDN